MSTIIRAGAYGLVDLSCVGVVPGQRYSMWREAGGKIVLKPVPLNPEDVSIRGICTYGHDALTATGACRRCGVQMTMPEKNSDCTCGVGSPEFDGPRIDCPVHGLPDDI